MRALVLAFCAGAVVAAPVPETPLAPKGPAPAFQTITAASLVKNTLRLVGARTQQVAKSVPTTVVRGNRTVTEYRTVTEPLLVTTTTEYPTDRYDIVIDGKVISAEAALPLLKKTSVVLVCEGALDPAYQKLLTREAVVIVKKK